MTSELNHIRKAAPGTEDMISSIGLYPMTTTIKARFGKELSRYEGRKAR